MTHQSSLATVPRKSDVATHRLTQWGFHMTKSHLKLVSPNILNGTVPPRRVPNADLRQREYLTEVEIERLIKAARRCERILMPTPHSIV